MCMCCMNNAQENAAYFCGDALHSWKLAQNISSLLWQKLGSTLTKLCPLWYLGSVVVVVAIKKKRVSSDTKIWCKSTSHTTNRRVAPSWHADLKECKFWMLRYNVATEMHLCSFQLKNSLPDPPGLCICSSSSRLYLHTAHPKCALNN